MQPTKALEDLLATELAIALARRILVHLDAVLVGPDAATVEILRGRVVITVRGLTSDTLVSQWSSWDYAKAWRLDLRAPTTRDRLVYHVGDKTGPSVTIILYPALQHQ